MPRLALEDINRLIEWKIDAYIARKARAKKGDKMPEQWPIELRADLEKIPEITKSSAQAYFKLRCVTGNRMSRMPRLAPEDINRLIEWKLARAKKGNKMQEQWTIELRADFADKEKIPEITKIFCAAARHMMANVMLLGPSCKPECVIFTDNFMSAPDKIDIYSDLIAKGQAELKAIADGGVTGNGNNEEASTEPSSELLAAMKE